MRDNILGLLEQKALLFTLEVRNHAKLGKNKNNEQLCITIYDDLKFELKMIGPSEQKRLKIMEFEAFDFRKRGNVEKATKFVGEIQEVWEVLAEKQQEERERHARRKYNREKRDYLKLERRYKLWRAREREGDTDYDDRTERRRACGCRWHNRAWTRSNNYTNGWTSEDHCSRSSSCCSSPSRG